ncbi:RAD21-like 1 (S. pombe) [Pristimantis euphronides]
MFYTYLLLGKRGILSKIWIAAHWEKKLTKAHIFECNLENAIQNIMAPKVVIALRTSGHLLLGVVRIYHRKAKYLLADCNEAFLNMKITFRPGALDLTENNQEASYNAITLPEEFPDFDIHLPDLNLIDVVDHFTLNQSRVEDITIREECDKPFDFFGSGFGDDLDTLRHGSASDGSFEVSTASVLPEQSSALLHGDSIDLFANDFFGDEGDPADFFDNNPLFNESNILDRSKDMSQDVMFPPEDQPPEAFLDETQESPLKNDQVADNTALICNEKIGFVLDPIDVTVIEKKRRSKRKRKLMVDDVKEIPSSRMHEQLRDTSDIVTTLDIAPPTEHLMEWQLTGGVKWLLSHPCQPIINTELMQLYAQTQLVIPKGVQKAPAKPVTETLRHEQEETDFPQLEVTKLTEVSSSIAEEPLDIIPNLNDCHRATSDVESLVHEGLIVLYSQQPGERRIENDEEEQRNKRTQHLLNSLRKLNQSGERTFSLQTLCKNNKRKQVSAKFYSCLVLKKQSAVKMTQSTPYGNINILPGPRFHTL